MGNIDEKSGCKIKKGIRMFHFTQPVVVKIFGDEFDLLCNSNPLTLGESSGHTLGNNLHKADDIERLDKEETNSY